MNNSFDKPKICYNNLLKGVAYTMLAGVDDPSAPLSDAWVWDMSRPALPLADVNGTLSFSVNTPPRDGFGVNAAGSFTKFGDTLGFGGGGGVADTMILGAARNNPSLTRFAVGTLTILADGVQVFSSLIYAPNNSSVIYNLTPHAAASVYTITITGLTPNATVKIPELFIGSSLIMPYFDLGHDMYGETYVSTAFKAATGREVLSRRYVRIEQTLKWSWLDAQKRNELKVFIESALEVLQPFWVIGFPDSDPTACYMGLHNGKSAPLKVGQAGYMPSFSLKFQEKL